MTRPMTPKQVAEHYGVHPTTVYGWLTSGKLAHFRLPSDEYRIRPEHLEAFEAGEWRGQSSNNPSSESDAPAPASGRSSGPRAGRRDLFRRGQETRPRPEPSATLSPPAAYPPRLVSERSE